MKTSPHLADDARAGLVRALLQRVKQAHLLLPSQAVQQWNAVQECRDLVHLPLVLGHARDACRDQGATSVVELAMRTQ